MLHELRTGMIHDLFFQTARQYSERIAVSDGEAELSYGELLGRTVRTGEYFMRELNINKADRIALHLPNCAEFIYAFLAAAAIGAVTIPLNINLKEKELEYFIIKCGINTVITNETLLSQWGQIPSRIKKTAFVTVDKWASDQHGGSHFLSNKESWFRGDDNDRTEVLYLCSSGSTGKPKIIPKTHAPILAGVANLGKALSVTYKDRFLGVTPFFHANGFENCMLLPLLRGASIRLMRQFTPGIMLQFLERNEITILIGSPFIFSALLDSADKPYRLSSIRFCLSTGSLLPIGLKKAFFDKFGVFIRVHYGSSETGPVSMELSDSGKGGSVGKPLDNVKVMIVDEGGKTLRSGETGEIIIHSNSMVSGYLSDETAAAEDTFTGGYYRTGDIGSIDIEGNIHIIGRKKSIINVSGVKIDPLEVKNVLLSHAKVTDAFVMGIKNKRGLELVKAIIVAQRDCTANELVVFCRERLADYKVPRIIEFRDKIPTDIMGKVIWSINGE